MQNSRQVGEGVKEGRRQGAKEEGVGTRCVCPAVHLELNGVPGSVST